MADAIVVTYHSAGSIGECLDALLAGGLHVVVVDNAGTATLVRERYPQVELIANEENVEVLHAQSTRGSRAAKPTSSCW